MKMTAENFDVFKFGSSQKQNISLEVVWYEI